MDVSAEREGLPGESRRRKWEDSDDDDDETDSSAHKACVPGLLGNDPIHTPSPGPRKSLHRVQQLQLEQMLDEGARRDVASEANFTQTFVLAKGLEDSISLDGSRSASKRRRLDEPYTPPVPCHLGNTTPMGRRPPTQRRHSIGTMSGSPIGSSARRAGFTGLASKLSPLSPRRPRPTSSLVEQLRGILPHLHGSGVRSMSISSEPGRHSPLHPFDFNLNLNNIPRAPVFYGPPSNLSDSSLTPMMDLDVITDPTASPTPCRTPRTTPVPSPEPSTPSDKRDFSVEPA